MPGHTLVFPLLLVLCVVVVGADPYDSPTCLIPESVGILPVADGDVWYNIRSQFVANTEQAGLCGTNGIILQPTPWHNPTIVAADPPAYRSDFLAFTALQLWARCDDGARWHDLSLHLSHWVASWSLESSDSRSVRLLDYVLNSTSASTAYDGGVDGALNGSWARVRIPLKNFTTPTWALGGVESLVFNTDSEYRECVVDNIALVDLAAPTLGPVVVETWDTISFEVSKRFSLQTAHNLSLYRLHSDLPQQGEAEETSAYGQIDHRYAVEGGVSPVDSGAAIQPTGWNAEDILQSRYAITLVFPHRLKEGARYVPAGRRRLHSNTLLHLLTFLKLSTTYVEQRD